MPCLRIVTFSHRPLFRLYLLGRVETGTICRRRMGATIRRPADGRRIADELGIRLASQAANEGDTPATAQPANRRRLAWDDESRTPLTNSRSIREG